MAHPAAVRAARASIGTRPIPAALAAVATAAALLVATTPVGAQGDAWPARPLRLIVTVPPGGAADFIARTVAPRLAEGLGQPIVVENRPGASGTIAADFVAKSPADGYTLLQNSITTHGIGPHLYPKLPYDTIRDFAPISQLARIPLIMTVNAAAVPVTGVREFVALARGRPGALAFASSGNGGAPHLTGELFKLATGTDMVHVPYKGSGPAVTDLLSGQVQVMFDGAPSLIQHVRSGKLRALAAASRQRNPLLPELPTFAELGYPDVDVALWYGLVAPAGTPPAVIARLAAETQKVLASTAIRERFASQGAETVYDGPEAFAKFIRDDIARWGPVVKKSGARAD
jgi:tripartite-type tricarboxylate transporter receptor subunit TctC